MSSTSTGMIRHTLDPDKPLALTAEEEEAWRYAQQMPDREIDYSDTPSQAGKTGWMRYGKPVSALVPEENKQQITLRLDADLLVFFKGTGRRYQSRINAVLREYMNAQKNSLQLEVAASKPPKA